MAKKKPKTVLKTLYFKPIPGVKEGQTVLSIRFDSTRWNAFIGGSGIGSRESLEEAKALLLEEARRHCLHIIEESLRVVEHYSRQLATLDLIPEEKP